MQDMQSAQIFTDKEILGDGLSAQKATTERFNTFAGGSERFDTYIAFRMSVIGYERGRMGFYWRQSTRDYLFVSIRSCDSYSI